MLVATSFQYSESVAIGGLRRAVLDAAPVDRGVAVQLTATPDQVAGLDTAVSGVLTQALGPVAPVDLALRSTSLAPVGLASDQASGHLTVVAGYPNLAAHARLTAGSWPVAGRNPVEASLSAAAATALGVRIGDQVSLADAATPGAGTTPLITLVVTGTWTTDEADPYWLGDPLDLAGVLDQGAVVYRGPFMVDPQDLLGRSLFKHLNLTWRAGLANDQLVPAVLPGLEAALPGLPASVAAVLPPHQAVTVSTGLGAVLSRVDQSLVLAQGGVTLIALQFIALAAYAVILVAVLLTERRRRENRILQARGATGIQVAGVTTAEAILIALPAVVLAPFGAALAIHLLGISGPLAGAGVELPLALSGSAIQAAGLAGLLIAATLVIPSLPTGGRLAAIRVALGRESSRIPVQRFGIDLALLAVAGIALWQLRLYGSPVIAGSRSVDPLLVAGPAVGLAACCLLATRALPRLAGLAEGRLAGRRSLLPQLGARDLARRPLRSSCSTLLVMLAAGLTVFALVYDATWFRSQVDQAEYQAATDLRVAPSAYARIPGESLGPAFRGLVGVTAAMPVVRTPVDVGGALRTASLLGVDATRMPALVTLPGGPGGAIATTLGELGTDRPGMPAAALPNGARRLAVTIDADVAAVQLEGTGPGSGLVQPVPDGIEVDAVIVDGDGQMWRFNATNKAAFMGKAQRIEIPLGGPGTTGLSNPIRLEALEVLATPPGLTTSTGTIDISRIESSTETARSTWTAIPFDPGQPGWSWVILDQNDQAPLTPPAGHPNRIAVGEGQIAFPIDGAPLIWRLSAGPPGGVVVEALASSSFLTATGEHVGDHFLGTVLGSPVDIQITGEARAVPPMDPGQPFLVVDAPTLSLADFVTGGGIVPVSEWWLSVQPGASADVARQLGAPPYSATQIVSRTVLEQGYQGDPVALAVVGALLLGAIAALVLGALGFLVGASTAIESRADEFALLRALGLSDRQLLRWLTIEQALLLAVGVVVGAALGLVFAWIVLPAVSFTPTGAPPVPDPMLVVPGAIGLGLAGGSLALLVVVILIARHRLGRISVSATLRAGAD
jgi:hypothetical protein